MTNTHWIPLWLDGFLIAPFRMPSEAHVGMWLGSLILAFYCIILGKIIYRFFFRLHAKYYAHMHDDVQRYHKISMDALHAGNKEAYFAANKMAHESFGKNFFARASVGIASIFPVPFALAWLALRFEGITLYTIPFTDIHMGYVFVFLTCYILLRIIWTPLKLRIVFLLRRKNVTA